LQHFFLVEEAGVGQFVPQFFVEAAENVKNVSSVEVAEDEEDKVLFEPGVECGDWGVGGFTGVV